MMFILIVLLILALAGGGLGYSQYGMAGGMGPIGLLLLIFLALYLTGNVHA